MGRSESIEAAARALCSSPRGGISVHMPGIVHVNKDKLEALDAALDAPEEPSKGSTEVALWEDNRRLRGALAERDALLVAMEAEIVRLAPGSVKGCNCFDCGCARALLTRYAKMTPLGATDAHGERPPTGGASGGSTESGPGATEETATDRPQDKPEGLPSFPLVVGGAPGPLCACGHAEHGNAHCAAVVFGRRVQRCPCKGMPPVGNRDERAAGTTSREPAVPTGSLFERVREALASAACHTDPPVWTTVNEARRDLDEWAAKARTWRREDCLSPGGDDSGAADLLRDLIGDRP